MDPLGLFIQASRPWKGGPIDTSCDLCPNQSGGGGGWGSDSPIEQLLGRTFRMVGGAIGKIKVCSGGGFVYGGGVGEYGPAKFELLGVVGYDSKEGGAHGGILAAGAGPLVVGVESMRTWSDWKQHTGPIGLLGGSTPTTGTGPFNIAGKDYGGFAQYQNGQLSVGGYGGGSAASGRAAGVGGYVTVSLTGKCQ